MTVESEVTRAKPGSVMEAGSPSAWGATAERWGHRGPQGGDVPSHMLCACLVYMRTHAIKTYVLYECM